MKRDKHLRDLSSEHHQALALARDIRKAGESASLDGVIQRVRSVYRNELRPHFDVEEQAILPALAKVGESALVKRTLSEHEQLEYLVEHLEEGDNLQQFARLLNDHVRFEERTLFEVCQEKLDQSSLAAIAVHSG